MIRKTLFLLALLTSCSSLKKSGLDFLIGEWKRENKEQFEVWEKAGSNRLEGYSYQVKDGQKIVTETLAIVVQKDQVVYQATVPDQNAGQTVSFILNTDTEGLFSFENPEHDFPNKIQYEPVTEEAMKVGVWGEAGKGFSYLQIKKP